MSARDRYRAGAPGIAILVLAVAMVARAHPAAAQEGFPSELLTISSLDLHGRHHVPAKELWAVIKTQRPSHLPWSERPVLRRDFLVSDAEAIATVCRQYGFLDVHVTWRVGEPHDGAVKVTFDIDEGPRSRISKVSFAGVHAFKERELRRRLLARAGRPFNPAYLVADTTRISDAYQERGYLPQVRAAFRRDSLDVHVLYEVDEGPLYRFGAVYFSSPGESNVKESLVRRELLIRDGEVFRVSRVQRSVERLYGTGLFSQVQMLPLPDSTHRRIEFDLRVRERKPRWLDAGIGSGTEERFRVTGEWGHRNLAGQGLQGVVSGRLALDGNGRFLLGRGDASLLEPWVAGTRTRGQVTIYYENRNDRGNPQWVVKQQARGVSFQLRREINRYAQVTVTQDNAFVNQDIVFEADLTQATRDSLIADVEPSYSTHRLQLAGDRDTRDDFLRTTHGSVQNLTGEVAGGPLSGSSSFTKWQTAFSWYTPVRGNWMLASRVRVGVINPFGSVRRFSPAESQGMLDADVARVPLEDRFRIGGVNSLRGFGENQVPLDGGLAVVQGNLELRVPLIGPFGAEFFVDAGNVWERAAYIKLKHFVPEVSHQSLGRGDVRYMVGTGARLDLPFGPLRVDFAWSLRPDEAGESRVHVAQFALGPTF